MDSTRDDPRPRSRSAERLRERGAVLNATGSNVLPNEPPLPNLDAVEGTTSELEPELRGKPGKGSRLDADS
jgi:hypothetical protein